jgi:hypothetical protein
MARPVYDAGVPVWHGIYLVEPVLYGGALWWAVCLLPERGTFGTARSFAAMAEVGQWCVAQGLTRHPEQPWGLAALLLALVPALAIWQQWARVRAWALLGHAAWWTVVTVMLARAGVWATGIGLYALLALAAAYLCWAVSYRYGADG